MIDIKHFGPQAQELQKRADKVGFELYHILFQAGRAIAAGEGRGEYRIAVAKAETAVEEMTAIFAKWNLLCLTENADTDPKPDKLMN